MSDQSCNCGCGTTAVLDPPANQAAETCNCGCCGPAEDETPQPDTTH